MKETLKNFGNEGICGIFVNEKGQILLVRRNSRRTYNPNTYDLMGGDIIQGNDPLQTFLKDAKEKLGIQINGEIIAKEPKNVDYPNQTVKTFPFICELNSKINFKLDLNKYDEWRWFDPGQINNLSLTPIAKKFLTSMGLI